MTDQSARSILAAFDPEDVAGAGIRSAALLAESTGAALHVLASTDGRSVRGTPAVDDELGADARAIVEQGLERLLEGRRRLVASVVVTDDDIVEAIRLRTSAQEPDMVVLGPHRPRGVWDVVAGSTADRVIRRSEVPCLLSNAELAWPIRRVLVPTDFSVPARRAVEVGAGWVGGLPEDAREATDVWLLHVNVRGASHPQPVDVDRLLEREAERGDAIRPGQLRFHQRIVNADDAAEGIERAALEIEPDLVVLGTHGYNWLGRALMGSVASQVALALPCPVLLVPPKRSGRWWIPDAHA